ncbi:MAG: ComEC/Rec2 family competence protein [Ginsengibacter sp.]
MSRRYKIYIWKKAPFLRIVLPFICGIIIQYYLDFPIQDMIFGFLASAILFLSFRLFKRYYKFKTSFLRGMILSFLVVVLGMLVTFQKDIRNHKKWYGNKYTVENTLVVYLNEPPVEKAKSYKALARVESIHRGSSAENVIGEFIIYFAKDPLSKNLKYGDRLLLNKPLQPIKNSGNPGEFDYIQHLAFQQIYHQVFLRKNEWVLLKGNNSKFVKSTLFNSREYAINTIEKYISGANQSGLAKALLIGYRVDLEKDLVQAYSNAGVVHLIAISGLHMALIYGLLYWMAMKIPLLKRSTTTRTIIILLCLWFFAFLTGAPPSVMRAAVMFSFIAAGSLFQKNSSIFNSLALSAFVLLCFNPYLLWNVGFQLSYLAVLGIVILQKPINNWFYFKNKILNYTWEIASVSISAQILTIPICFYYFHQLPIYFIIANIIAIPLATVALWGLIALVGVSPIPVIADFIGNIVSGFLWLMNKSVLFINTFPFALWENVSLSVWSTLTLYTVFCCLCFWLIKKNQAALKTGLILALLFVLQITHQKWQAFNQRTIIVYNIPSQNALDFINGNKYKFIADPEVQSNKLIYNFHLKPSRILLQAHKNDYKNDVFFSSGNFYKFFDKRIVILDTLMHPVLPKRLKVDYIILTKNPKIKIADLLPYYECEQIIFTSSNSMWKIGEWKKECEELFLRFHSVSEQGAFVIAF